MTITAYFRQLERALKIYCSGELRAYPTLEKEETAYASLPPTVEEVLKEVEQILKKQADQSRTS